MISTVRGRFAEFEGAIEAAPDYHQSKVRGTVKTASDWKQLNTLVSCLRQDGARVEVWTPSNVPAYQRRTFTNGVRAMIIVTAPAEFEELHYRQKASGQQAETQTKQPA